MSAEPNANQIEFSTPMMQQYIQIKKNYPDAILFFRLGDFYEMFLEDAHTGSKVLGITLTSRNKGQDGQIPMAGIPYHAAETYISKLVNAGYKVAICEQTTLPQKGQEVVEREVTRVVTPSTNLTDSNNDRNYLMNFHFKKNIVGICLVGIKTGEVLFAEEKIGSSANGFRTNNPPASNENNKLHAVLAVLNEYASRYQPAEILLDPDWYQENAVVRNFHRQGISPFVYGTSLYRPSQAQEKICQHFDVTSLEGFGIDEMPNACTAFAHALDYLQNTQNSELKFLKEPQVIRPTNHMHLSRQTIRNLELFSTIRSGEKSASLFAVLDQTQTPMGSRKLRSWLLRPLLEVARIAKRQDLIEELFNQPEIIALVNHKINGINDIERCIGRLAIGIGNARDLIAIKHALVQFISLYKELKSKTVVPQIVSKLERLENASLTEITGLIDQVIMDEPSALLTEGNIIKPGYNNELDILRSTAEGGHNKLTALETRERAQTGISTLKIGFNKVFGYFIEVSKTQISKVPPEYSRRQTLTNAERYIIPELKEHEDLVLNAQEKASKLEYDLYLQLVKQVLEKVNIIQQTAEMIASLDVYSALAQTALANHYVRPILDNSHALIINDGRHPVVEKILTTEKTAQFVPNSLNMTDKRFIVLTGANMAGKSTYIRQNALIVILAQIGSFVPAASATIGIINQIHTRIGAMDDLASGLSTFMVEMIETANILNNLSDQSLVILDEIGRGTSTYDGVSIAWSVSEYLLQNSQAKTLFATHYHELTQLTNDHPDVINLHLTASEKGDDISFLYHVEEGKADQSYGIQVAHHAGLPKSVIRRASEILGRLSENSTNPADNKFKQMRLFN